ncbi:helix-turn-helix transcriptional regulator [Phormidesmis sp. 146-12]
MTAPLVLMSSKVQPVMGAWSSYRSPRRSSSHAYARSGKQAKTIPSESGSTFGSPGLNALWITLIESMQDGVLVIAHNLLPVYTNMRAKELCQQMLMPDEETEASLPGVITEACHRLLKEGRVTDEALMVEYQGHQGQVIRLRVRWLTLNSSRNSSEETEPYILVQLENRQTELEEDLRVDRQKYDLTEREAEIWMLLRQEHTYQEIAELLQISLNTVKTHVKNVYAKRRSSLGQRRVWYSR